jgi:hypothetical protein
MTKLLVTAAGIALLALPAFAQSSVTTTETTTQQTTQPMPAPMPPMPAPPPEASGSSYESHTVTHSDNGVTQTDKSTDKYVAPDGTVQERKVIQQQDRE